MTENSCSHEKRRLSDVATNWQLKAIICSMMGADVIAVAPADWLGVGISDLSTEPLTSALRAEMRLRRVRLHRM